MTEEQERAKSIKDLIVAAKKASAELRHIYKAAFLNNRTINAHDEGIIHRSIMYLETAVSAVEKVKL